MKKQDAINLYEKENIENKGGMARETLESLCKLCTEPVKCEHCIINIRISEEW